MNKLIASSLFLLIASPLWGQAQPLSSAPQINQPSLGEVARKLRAEEEKANLQGVKVYTNDNLPRGGGLSVVGPSAPAEAVESPAPPGTGEPGPATPHGKEYFRSRMAKLEQRLETDKRELAVLQQKLSQANIQYYPDPNKTLMQEYSRSDIDKLTQKVEQQNRKIAEDEQAIQDLKVELAREGGEPGWLEPGNQGWAAAILKAQQAQAKADSKAPLRDQLKDARRALASAKEQQRLAENELSLLQLQQARELDPGVQADLASKIDARRAEIAAAKAAVEAAQKRLDRIQSEIAKRQAEATKNNGS
jgi:hypothetical protein